jgi:hypothetical protein
MSCSCQEQKSSLPVFSVMTDIDCTHSFTPFTVGSSMKYLTFPFRTAIVFSVLAMVFSPAAVLAATEAPTGQNTAAASGQDDVLSTIDQAIKQYKAGDLSGAASNVEYAAQLIRQKKSEKMKDLLPEPLAGWKGSKASAQAMGTAVFGGGVTVARKYSRDTSSVEVEIVSDSPVLQSVMMMLNNPMFAGAGGGNLQTIKGQRAIVKYDPSAQNGEIDIVDAGRFMITVKGQNVEQDELVKYAAAVDYQGLTKY